MTIHEASRTLLKSPPELWAECSDAASLMRHLDQFGEIRITRLEPETAVAWEGETASGTVRFEPSGWGTRVILTAEEVDPVVTGGEVVVEPAEVQETAAVAEQEPVVDEPASVEPDEPVTVGEPDEDDEAVTVAEPDEPVALMEPAPPEVIGPAPVSFEPTPRGGFFTRLMARMRGPAPGVAAPNPPVAQPGTRQPVAQPSTSPPFAQPTPQVVQSTPHPEPESERESESEREPTPESEPPMPEPAAQTPAPESPPQTVTPEPPSATIEPPPSPALDALTGALDSLGMAHHRPFSRS
jgi:hypothetical protein